MPGGQGIINYEPIPTEWVSLQQMKLVWQIVLTLLKQMTILLLSIRTIASAYATKCLLEYIGDSPISGWQRKTFTPCYIGTEYGYDLENLKSYYIAAGLETNFLTDYQWSKISIDQ